MPYSKFIITFYPSYSTYILCIYGQFLCIRRRYLSCLCNTTLLLANANNKTHLTGCAGGEFLARPLKGFCDCFRNSGTVISASSHMQQHLCWLSLESLAEAFHSPLPCIPAVPDPPWKSLLETTSLPMGEIADTVGVNDTSYLNKIFKKKYGLTPLQYRKQFQQEC